jgi:hypothetical protein
MKTQSADTHPDAEGMLIHLIRNAPMSKRFRLIQSLTQEAICLHMQAWRARNPHLREQEAAVQMVSCWHGPALAAQVQERFAQRADWHLHPSDVLTAMLPALDACDEQNIFCYLGGSIASSLHGMQQMAQDIDLVLELNAIHLSALLPLLKQHYVFDETALREAVAGRSICSLIHLDTLLKVDLVMVRTAPLETALRPLIKAYQLDEHARPVQVASASEMILFKLARYQQDMLSRQDGMHDDAEWNDIVGMLKVQGPDLDLTLLEQWSRTLQVTETWQEALAEAGVTDSSGMSPSGNALGKGHEMSDGGVLSRVQKASREPGKDSTSYVHLS